MIEGKSIVVYCTIYQIRGHMWDIHKLHYMAFCNIRGHTGTYISYIAIYKDTCGTYMDIYGREEAVRILKSGLFCDAPAPEKVRG
jgi:hypothetical protein